MTLGEALSCGAIDILPFLTNTRTDGDDITFEFRMRDDTRHQVLGGSFSVTRVGDKEFEPGQITYRLPGGSEVWRWSGGRFARYSSSVKEERARAAS